MGLEYPSCIPFAVFGMHHGNSYLPSPFCCDIQYLKDRSRDLSINIIQDLNHDHKISIVLVDSGSDNSGSVKGVLFKKIVKRTFQNQNLLVVSHFAPTLMNITMAQIPLNSRQKCIKTFRGRPYVTQLYGLYCVDNTKSGSETSVNQLCICERMFSLQLRNCRIEKKRFHYGL